MSYQTGKTIEEVINKIYERKYLIPSIQREFVWKRQQIEFLFDSIMRKYPINSFLFWKVTKPKITEYQFYDFISEYEEKKIYSNKKSNIDGKKEITAILDGQQRLTSFYIGLKGKYKTINKSKTKFEDYHTRTLYLNLIKESDKEDMIYDFAFLTKSEINQLNNKEEHFFFRVGEILNLDKEEINEYIEDNLINYNQVKKQEAILKLTKLYESIKEDLVIYEYLEEEQDLNKVLNIFIRTNSGGTKLSHSDLLLSIASSEWKIDAREEIIETVKNINKIGRGFKVDKDFILKSLLVLSDIPNVVFKVSNFNKRNMKIMEDNFMSIKKTLTLTFNLISSFGYQKETLSSNNAIIPIAYYIYKNQYDHKFIQSSKYANDRIIIKEWLTIAILKQIFNSQSDSVLSDIRNTIRESKNQCFPKLEIENKFEKSITKSHTFTELEIENLLDKAIYGKKETFLLLQFLYKSFDFKNKFHIDHMHPSSFTKIEILKKNNILLSDEKYEYFKTNVNNIANLQLLEEVENIEKTNKQFEIWYNNKEDNKKEDYKNKHYIPNLDNYSINNFEKFYTKRKEILKDELIKELIRK